MPVTERIAKMRVQDQALSQARSHEVEAERVRQEEEQDSKRQRNLSLFEEFLKETGLRSMFEEIIEGENLGSAEIDTLVNQEGNSVSLEMKWPGEKRARIPDPKIPGLVYSPPEPGFNKISFGVDYLSGQFFVKGALQKYGSTLARLNPEDLEEAVARAYLDPKWESGIRVELASEAAK